jgi:hypothetical protein
MRMISQPHNCSPKWMLPACEGVIRRHEPSRKGGRECRLLPVVGDVLDGVYSLEIGKMIENEQGVVIGHVLFPRAQLSSLSFSRMSFISDSRDL